MARFDIHRLRSRLRPTAEELETRRARIAGPKNLAGISQLELANRLGLSKRTVQCWERLFKTRSPNCQALALMRKWEGELASPQQPSIAQK